MHEGETSHATAMKHNVFSMVQGWQCRLYPYFYLRLHRCARSPSSLRPRRFEQGIIDSAGVGLFLRISPFQSLWGRLARAASLFCLFHIARASAFRLWVRLPTCRSLFLLRPVVSFHDIWILDIARELSRCGAPPFHLLPCQRPAAGPADEPYAVQAAA